MARRRAPGWWRRSTTCRAAEQVHEGGGHGPYWSSRSLHHQALTSTLVMQLVEVEAACSIVMPASPGGTSPSSGSPAVTECGERITVDRAAHPPPVLPGDIFTDTASATMRSSNRPRVRDETSRPPAGESRGRTATPGFRRARWAGRGGLRGVDLRAPARNASWHPPWGTSPHTRRPVPMRRSVMFRAAVGHIEPEPGAGCQPAPAPGRSSARTPPRARCSR